MPKFHEPLASETIKQLIFNASDILHIALDKETVELISNCYDTDKLYEVQLLLLTSNDRKKSVDLKKDIQHVLNA